MTVGLGEYVAGAAELALVAGAAAYAATGARDLGVVSRELALRAPSDAQVRVWIRAARKAARA